MDAFDQGAVGGKHFSAACAILILLCGQGISSALGATAYIRQEPQPGDNSTTILNAFTDQSINLMVLLEDVCLRSSEWAVYTSSPVTMNILVSRNVTITATNPDTQLDFNYLRTALLLDSSTALILANMSIFQMRRGSGVNLDLVQGLEGSKIVLINVVRYRRVCTPLARSVLSARVTPRPPAWPGPQLLEAVNTSRYHHGRLYAGGVHFVDYAREPVSNAGSEDEQQWFPGYSIRLLNSTGLCASYVDEACVVAQGADRCMSQAITDLVEAEAAGGQGPVSVAAVVVPVVVGVALLAIAAVLARCWWRRWRQRRPEPERLLPVAAAKGGDTASMAALDHGPPPGSGSNLATAQQLQGWRLMAHRRAGEADGAPGQAASDLMLGTLLGAGSFGRVYRGSWEGVPVAVKVLVHEHSSTVRVANEVNLMLDFKHENVVRAYYYATYCRGGHQAYSLAPGDQQQQPAQAAGNKLGPPEQVQGLEQLARSCIAADDPQAGGVSRQQEQEGSASSGSAQGLQGLSSRHANIQHHNTPGLPLVAMASAASRAASSSWRGEWGSSGQGSVPAPATGAGGGVATGAAGAAVGEAAGVPYALGSGPSAGSRTGMAAAPASFSTMDTRWSHLGSSVLGETPGSNGTWEPRAHPGAAGFPLAPGQRTLQALAAAQQQPAEADAQQEPAEVDVQQHQQPRSGTQGGASLPSAPREVAWVALAVDGTPPVAWDAALGSGSCAVSGSQAENDETQTWLVLEYCDGGTLADALRDGRLRGSDGSVDMALVLQLLWDVASGLGYLHSRNVLHGDLKNANVLLKCRSYGGSYTCKVTDFGLSRALAHGETHRSTRTVGTVTHMPPELLRAGKKSAAGDVYAFGIMMWELLAGSSAFGGLHFAEVIERVAMRGERPPLPGAATPSSSPHSEASTTEPAPAAGSSVGKGGGAAWPADYVALMQACWAQTPSERPAFPQVLQRLHDMRCRRWQLASSTPSTTTSCDRCGAALAGQSPPLEQQQLRSGGEEDEQQQWQQQQQQQQQGSTLPPGQVVVLSGGLNPKPQLVTQVVRASKVLGVTTVPLQRSSPPPPTGSSGVVQIEDL